MKKVKNLLLLLCITLVALTGCGEKNIEGELSDILEKVYEPMYTEFEQDERPMLDNIDVLEVVPDNVDYYIGTKEIEYKEVYASEPMMSSIAYSVVLVRMEKGADVEAAKQEIKETINPRKWMCVEVAEEDVIVKSKGDLIIIIMVEDENLREKIEEGFDNL